MDRQSGAVQVAERLGTHPQSRYTRQPPVS